MIRSYCKKIYIVLLVAVLIVFSGCYQNLDLSNKNGNNDNIEEAMRFGQFDYQIIMLDSQSGSQMMSFIMTDKEGEVFVVDGGRVSDAQYLVDNIKLLGGHVTGWFFSHYHGDHIGAFIEILNNEELRNQIEIEKIYYNFPNEEYASLFETDENDINALKQFNQAIKNINLKQEITNNYYTYEFSSINVEVLRLYNPEIRDNFGNNSTTVYTFHMGRTKMCFLGDLGVEGGNELLAMHPQEELKCQIVQMAHHGTNGVNKDVYLALEPKICFWPTPLWLWNNDIGEGEGSGPWLTVEVRKWIDEIGAVSFVSKNGKQFLYLTD